MLLGFLVLLALLPGVAAAQEGRVEILYAGSLEGYTTPEGEPARKLLRDATSQVRMKQDSILMFCDSAIQYESRSFVRFLGNVRVLMPTESGRTVTLTADRIDYDSGTRVAELYDNITLNDAGATLRTNRMTYYRWQSFGYYQGGGTLTDVDNVLRSRLGYYYATERKARFRGQVVLTNPRYVMTTDSLDYAPPTRTAYFVMPTLLTGQGKAQRVLYTLGGWYNTARREAFLYPRARYNDSSYTVLGDTLYYADSLDRGWAHCGVQMFNRDTTLAVFGERGTFDRATRTSVVTEDAFMIQRFDGDTLTLFADTLFSVDDSLRAQRALRAYHQVRFSMRNLQGKADSLVYERVDSVLTMYRDPVLWAGASQLTGDTVVIYMKNKQADSLYVYQNAFVASAENLRDFNQVQGRRLRGKFHNNRLTYSRVEGNVEVIYFNKDDSVQTGMTRLTSNILNMWLDQNQPYYIQPVSKVQGSMYPMHEIALEPNRLKGFRWRLSERPRRYLLPEAPAMPPLLDPRNPVPLAPASAAPSQPQAPPATSQPDASAPRSNR